MQFTLGKLQVRLKTILQMGSSREPPDSQIMTILFQWCFESSTPLSSLSGCQAVQFQGSLGGGVGWGTGRVKIPQSCVLTAFPEYVLLRWLQASGEFPVLMTLTRILFSSVLTPANGQTFQSPYSAISLTSRFRV